MALAAAVATVAVAADDALATSGGVVSVAAETDATGTALAALLVTGGSTPGGFM
jgi:hypothetical protein